MPTRKENIQRNAKIVAAIKSGKTNKEVAEKFAITRESVRLIGLKGGLLSFRAQKKIRNINVIEDFKKGRTVKELSLKYKLCDSCLQNILTAGGQSSEFQLRTKLINKKIKDLFHHGFSSRKIADVFNQGRATILLKLHKQGLYYRISKEKTADRNKEIISDIKNGKKASEISDKYSIGIKRINQITGAAGISYSKIRQIRNEKIIRDIENGTSIQKVALKYKMSVVQIYKIFKK